MRYGRSFPQIKVLAGVLLLLLSLCTNTARVFALPDDQLRVYESGIPYFDLTETISSCGESGALMPAGGIIDRILQSFASRESGGNPTASAPPPGTASGKYQYIDRTWGSVTQTYYPPAHAYARAMLAPEPMQDAVAYIEYTKKFNDMGGNLFNLAVSHFYPAALGDPSLLDTSPGHNGGLTVRQYADRFVADVSGTTGLDIQLHYRDAPEFDTHLQRVGGQTTSVPTTPATSGGCSGPNTSINVQCPANLVEHPQHPGYFDMPAAPAGEYVLQPVSHPDRHHGSRELVCAIYSVALAFNQATGGASKLQIGDLNAGGHSTHKYGVAVDLSGAGEFQAASHIDDWKGTYSKEWTLVLGDLFLKTGTIKNIWWCGPGSVDDGVTSNDQALDELVAMAAGKLGPGGQIKCIDGHHDHFHIDLKDEFRKPEWTP